MRKVAEREFPEFIRPGRTEKWMLLCESRHGFLECFVMYETEIPRVNGMMDV